ncbi:MAG: gliding motility-associated ABC transporter substrate-binding protein GldG [Prevotellaceae bacterium]|jgi:ABC-2 type transport system permease protein|nr:gliding motility-associated ABC transporter substrate-binding protein GldG [Prevotellaceae bacterium]
MAYGLRLIIHTSYFRTSNINMTVKQKDILHFFTVTAGAVALFLLANAFHLRLDLTADKRYTLSAATKKLLHELPGSAFIRVYLEGEMPVGVRPLQRAVKDMLSDMQAYSGGRLQYEFVNPAPGRQKEAFYRDLLRKGLLPYTVQEKNAEGGVTQINLFPGAVVSLSGRQRALNLLEVNRQISTEENVNNAIQNLEYLFTSAVEELGRKELEKIAFIDGHGELSAAQVADAVQDLSAYYRVNRITLSGDVNALNDYALAVVAKPSTPWSEADKLAIDQHIMRGGKVAWFIDPVTVHEDSLANGHVTFGIINDHNLNDMLFRYGVRINANVVQDLQCALIPVNVAPAGMPAKFSPMPWTYYPLLYPSPNNPISRNLNVVKTEFPGTLDTLPGAGVAKQVLLSTSPRSFVKNAPFYVGLEQVVENIDARLYSRGAIPVAALLQGEFSSIFQHRALSSYNNGRPFAFAAKSVPTAQVVVADGDVIRNDVTADGSPLPLGYDRYTRQALYGNKGFVQNVVAYLLDDSGLMSLRSKVVAMRLLDRARVVQERTAWIAVNTVAPLALLALGGVCFVLRRKKKYGGRVLNLKK